MGKNAKCAGIVAFLLFSMVSCGNDENLVSQDGPIANPAIEAGATQAQNSVPENLEIEIEGETVIINNDGDLEPLENFTVSEVATLTNCTALLSNPPSLTIDRCSYAPNSEDVLIDQLAPGECENGTTYVTLNRLDGSGAYVGVVGESWFDLSDQDLNSQTVELICQGLIS